MNSIFFTTKLKIFQLQAETLMCLVGAESAKEYPAEWRKGSDNSSNTVLRDQFGKFAKSAKSLKEDLLSNNVALDIIESKIEKIIGNKLFFENFKTSIDNLLDILSTNIKKLPVSTGSFNMSRAASYIFGKDQQTIVNTVAKEYEKESPVIAEAIRGEVVNPIKEPVENVKKEEERLSKNTEENITIIDPIEKVEPKTTVSESPINPEEEAKNKLRQEMYKLIDQWKEEKIEKDNKFKEEIAEPLEHVVKQIRDGVKTAVPLATLIALAVGPELAIGLVLKQSLGEIASSIALGQASSIAISKGLDSLKIDDEKTRTGIEIVAGIVTAILVSSISSTIPNRQLKNAGKKAEEILAAAHPINKAKLTLSKMDLVKYSDDLLKYREQIENNLYQKGEKTFQDLILKKILSDQGFDQLPHVISTEEMDLFVKKGEKEVFRGVVARNPEKISAPEMVEQLKRGELYAGKGNRGNGLYVASGKTMDGENAKETARYYAIHGDGHSAVETVNEKTSAVIRMSIKKGARTISYEKLKTMMQGDKLANNFDYKNLFKDPGRYAAMKGYDVIIPEKSRGEMVILNRTVLRIQEESVFP